jgi:hypothetical protein
MTTPHEQRLVHYLIGDMREDERIALEDEYFADDHLLERLQAAETDLIDAYVRGQLSPDQRPAFEQRYMTDPDQVARVDAARRLIATTPEAPAILRARTPHLRQFATLAASVVVVAGAYIAVRQMNTATIHTPVPSPVVPLASPAPASEVEPPFVFLLTDGVTRSADAQLPLVIPESSDTVHLLTPVPQPVTEGEYSATITTPEGTTVHATDDVAFEGASKLRTAVPAGQLKPGDYILTISSRRARAEQVLGEYSFRVALR